MKHNHYGKFPCKHHVHHRHEELPATIGLIVCFAITVVAAAIIEAWLSTP